MVHLLIEYDNVWCISRFDPSFSLGEIAGVDRIIVPIVRSIFLNILHNASAKCLYQVALSISALYWQIMISSSEALI